MHQTDNLDDGYMGSGKILKRSIKKNGINNFHKEILFIFDNEKEMKDKEKELVVINETTSYNLCPGGKGGFGYINSTGLNVSGVKNRDYKEIARKVAVTKSTKTYTVTDETKEKISFFMKTDQSRKNKISASLKGQTKSEDHRKKISEALKEAHKRKAV